MSCIYLFIVLESLLFSLNFQEYYCEIRSVSACNSVNLEITCLENHKIAIERIFFGARDPNNRPDCQAEGNADPACCQRGYGDCISYNSNTETVVKRLCSGRRECIYPVRAVRTDRCYNPALDRSDYMTVYYNCIPDSVTGNICSDDFIQAKPPIYLSNEGYPLPRSGSSNCTCMVVKDPDQETITAKAIEISFIDSQCSFSLTVRHGDGKLDTFPCNYGLGGYREWTQITADNATFSLVNEDDQGDAYLWLELNTRETSENSLSLYCGDALRKLLNKDSMTTDSYVSVTDKPAVTSVVEDTTAATTKATEATTVIMTPKVTTSSEEDMTTLSGTTKSDSKSKTQIPTTKPRTAHTTTKITTSKPRISTTTAPKPQTTTISTTECTSTLTTKSFISSTNTTTSLFTPSTTAGASLRPTTTVTTIKTLITTIKPQTTTIKRPITTLKRPITTIKRPITTIKRPITTIKRPITTIKRPITTIKRPITTINRQTTIKRQTTTIKQPFTTTTSDLAISTGPVYCYEECRETIGHGFTLNLKSFVNPSKVHKYCRKINDLVSCFESHSAKCSSVDKMDADRELRANLAGRQVICEENLNEIQYLAGCYNMKHFRRGLSSCDQLLYPFDDGDMTEKCKLKEDLADCVEAVVEECKNETVSEFMINITNELFNHLYNTENCDKESDNGEKETEKPKPETEKPKTEEPKPEPETEKPEPEEGDKDTLKPNVTPEVKSGSDPENAGSIVRGISYSLHLILIVLIMIVLS